jgi:hypothetical protein
MTVTLARRHVLTITARRVRATFAAAGSWMSGPDSPGHDGCVRISVNANVYTQQTMAEFHIGQAENMIFIL